MPHVESPRPVRRARSWIPVLLVAAASVSLVACAKSEQRTTARAASAPAAAAPGRPGADVYNRSCARCHGANLQGKSGTPPIDQARLAGLGDQRLRITISSGKGKMPAFGGLSAAEVDALISYLKAVA